MAKARQSKVLRIGVIQDGKIVQERLMKAGEPVTVGESARSTFVLPKTGLPAAEFPLFETGADGYVLRFTTKMRGKIRSGGAVVALKKLREDPGMRRDGDVWLLPLTEQDRGKVAIDKVTVLFQFVAPPPVQAVTPIQAMDFRPRLLEDDDPVFLGFLAIWLALAVVLTIWVAYTAPREMTMDEIPDRFKRIVMAEKQAPPAPDPASKEPSEDVVEPEPEPEPEPEAEPEKPKTKVEEAKRQEDVRQEVLKESKLLLKLIGTRGESSGAATENLFDDEDQALGDLDSKIEAASGVTTESAKATRGGEGTDLGAEDIGNLEQGGGGNAKVSGGPKVTVSPQVAAGSGTVDEEIGDAGKVTQVVKRYAGQLKYCYEKRLLEDPGLEGRVEIGWTVVDGSVEGLYVVSNSTADGELADCIMKKIRRWTFPEDISGDIPSWPFVFTAKSQ
ncbi:MAG: hypothetical protein ACI8PZ_006478 [Myxococcota bacterium]|jgi:hypothetical protein